MEPGDTSKPPNHDGFLRDPPQKKREQQRRANKANCGSRMSILLIWEPLDSLDIPWRDVARCQMNQHFPSSLQFLNWCHGDGSLVVMQLTKDWFSREPPAPLLPPPPPPPVIMSLLSLPSVIKVAHYIYTHAEQTAAHTC